jgi:hypothetical protein
MSSGWGWDNNDETTRKEATMRTLNGKELSTVTGGTDEPGPDECGEVENP